MLIRWIVWVKRESFVQRSRRFRTNLTGSFDGFDERLALMGLHRYKELSLKFYTILLTHADELEAVSVDEALVDVTSGAAYFAAEHPTAVDPAKGLAESIRAEIREATNCEGESSFWTEELVRDLPIQSALA